MCYLDKHLKVSVSQGQTLQLNAGQAGGDKQALLQRLHKTVGYLFWPYGGQLAAEYGRSFLWCVCVMKQEATVRSRFSSCLVEFFICLLSLATTVNDSLVESLCSDIIICLHTSSFYCLFIFFYCCTFRKWFTMKWSLELIWTWGKRPSIPERNLQNAKVPTVLLLGHLIVALK